MRKLIRISEVLRIVKYQQNSINRLVSRGQFPKPITLRPSKNTRQSVAWLKSEILEWEKTHEREPNRLPELLKKWNQSHSEILLLEIDLLEFLDLSYSYLVQIMRDNQFPKPINLPRALRSQLQTDYQRRRKVWRESDIEAWIDERIAERDKD